MLLHFCRPGLLSVGKGGFPAHFVHTELAGAVAIALCTVLWISPAPAAGRVLPHSPPTHSGHTVVVSFKIKDPHLRHHCTSYPREPALFTVPHLYSKFRHLFFFQAKITMQTFKRKTLPKVIFSLDFYLVSCNV